MDPVRLDNARVTQPAGPLHLANKVLLGLFVPKHAREKNLDRNLAAGLVIDRGKNRPRRPHTDSSAQLETFRQQAPHRQMDGSAGGMPLQHDLILGPALADRR